MEFTELIEALETMPQFAQSLSVDEQATLAGALRKAADGVVPTPEPEQAEANNPVQKSEEEGADLNSEPEQAEPEQAKPEQAEPEQAEAADNPVQKNDGMALVLEKLDGLQGALGAVSQNVTAIDSRLSQVEKSVDVPAAGVIESTGTEEVGNPNAKAIPWEMDLNTAE